MSQARADEIHDYIAWLSSGSDIGTLRATELEGLSSAERPARFRAIPVQDRYHVLTSLIRDAADRLFASPAEALDITQFVIAHLAEVVVPPGFDVVMTLLRGTAWTEHANALRGVGDLPAALDAAERAMDILEACPAAAIEVARAQRVAAMIRHLKGETGEPLRIIRDGLAVFEAHNDLAGVVRSRMYEATIEYDLDRTAEAMSIFETALRLAEEIEDHSTQAALHNNIGHCAEALGDPSKAIQHFVVALQLYDLHGMRAERPRALWGLAQVSAKAGRVDEAIRELERVAGQLFDQGMPLESARVWLDVADLFLQAGRSKEAETLAEELVERFTDAGASREALRAWRQIGEAARTGALDAETLLLARQTIDDFISG